MVRNEYRMMNILVTNDGCSKFRLRIGCSGIVGQGEVVRER